MKQIHALFPTLIYESWYPSYEETLKEKYGIGVTSDNTCNIKRCINKIIDPYINGTFILI